MEPTLQFCIFIFQVYVRAHIAEMNSFREKLVQRRENLLKQRLLQEEVDRRQQQEQQQLNARPSSSQNFRRPWNSSQEASSGFLSIEKPSQSTSGIPGLDFEGDPEQEEVSDDPIGEEVSLFSASTIWANSHIKLLLDGSITSDQP